MCAELIQEGMMGLCFLVGKDWSEQNEMNECREYGRRWQDLREGPAGRRAGLLWVGGYHGGLCAGWGSWLWTPGEGWCRAHPTEEAPSQWVAAGFLESPWGAAHGEGASQGSSLASAARGPITAGSVDPADASFLHCSSRTTQMRRLLWKELSGCPGALVSALLSWPRCLGGWSGEASGSQWSCLRARPGSRAQLAHLRQSPSPNLW